MGLLAAPWYGERRWVVEVCPGLTEPKVVVAMWCHRLWAGAEFGSSESARIGY